MRVVLRVIRVSRFAVVVMVVMMVISIVMKGDTVELLKWIGYLAHGGSKARVKGHTLGFGSTDVHTLGFLDISEIRRFYALALVGNDRRLHVTQ